MEIVCKNCSKKYRIDESKLPKNEKVYIKCAGCYQKIAIEPVSGDEDPPPKPSKDQAERPGVSTQPNPSRPAEYFEPGTRAALVYCEDVQARLEMEKNISNLGFEVRSINNREDARHHFRYNIFDVVIIYQKGPDPEKNLLDVLDYFNHLTPEIRRKVTVIYIHLAGNRFNLLEAFSKGVDVTLSPMDLTNLQEMLPVLLEEKNTRYRIFTECLQKVEEAVL